MIITKQSLASHQVVLVAPGSRSKRRELAKRGRLGVRDSRGNFKALQDVKARASRVDPGRT